MSVRKVKNKNSPFSSGAFDRASFVIGAEISNIINVAIQLFDGNDEVAERVSLEAYLSSDANGDSLATAPTTVAIATDGLLIPLIANRAFRLTSEADGDIALNITLSSGAATYHLVLVRPDGRLIVSGPITFAA